MKRLALCVVLVLLSWGPGAMAQSYKCILTNSCKAPSCEFLGELKRAKAFVRAHAKVAAPDSTSTDAHIRWSDQIHDEVGKVMKGYQSKCPSFRAGEGVAIARPVEPECTIDVKDASGKIRPGSLDDIQKASSTCSEVVEAEYNRQVVRQSQCQSAVSGGRTDTVARRRANQLMAAQEKVDSLQGSLLRYLSSCEPDANLARDLSKLGLDALMKDGKAARDEWLASRASGASAVAGAR